MAWNSQQFIFKYSNWLKTNNSSGFKETSNKIAELYIEQANNVTPKLPQWKSSPIKLKNKSIISNGFYTSFNSAFDINTGSYKNLNSIVWKPSTDSIISFWLNVKFDLQQPAPGGTTSSSNIITFPGEETLLNLNITNSFRTNNFIKTATLLNSAFINHLSTVKGLWSGSSGSNPLTVNWEGLI